MHQIVNVVDLVVDHVQSHDDAFLRDHLREPLTLYLLQIEVLQALQQVLVDVLELEACALHRCSAPLHVLLRHGHILQHFHIFQGVLEVHIFRQHALIDLILQLLLVRILVAVLASVLVEHFVLLLLHHLVCHQLRFLSLYAVKWPCV